MPDIQLYPFIQQFPLSDAVYHVAVDQIIDFTAFGVHRSDLRAVFALIPFECAALEKRDFERVNAENLLQIFIILVQVTETTVMHKITGISQVKANIKGGEIH